MSASCPALRSPPMPRGWARWGWSARALCSLLRWVRLAIPIPMPGRVHVWRGAWPTGRQSPRGHNPCPGTRTAKLDCSKWDGVGCSMDQASVQAGLAHSATRHSSPPARVEGCFVSLCEPACRLLLAPPDPSACADLGGRPRLPAAGGEEGGDGCHPGVGGGGPEGGREGGHGVTLTWDHKAACPALCAQVCGPKVLHGAPWSVQQMQVPLRAQPAPVHGSIYRRSWAPLPKWRAAVLGSPGHSAECAARVHACVRVRAGAAQAPGASAPPQRPAAAAAAAAPPPGGGWLRVPEWGGVCGGG